MSEILTRLLLNTKDFDSKLNKAKQSSDDFSSVLKGKVGGALKTVAATIGLAVGAAETFNKVIHSSQSTSDAWNNTLSACKSTVDAFFQSLSTGNWSAFNNGLESTLVKMREVAVLKDMLGDAKLSMGFETRMFERDYVRLEGIIDDETKSIEERTAAYASMQKLIADYNSKVESTASGAAKTLVAELDAKFGKEYTLDNIRDYISNYNNEFLDNESIKKLKEYKKQLADLEKQQYSYITSVAPGSIWGGSITTRTENTEVTAQINALKQQNQELEKMRLLNEDNDENRIQMIKDYEYALELQQRGAEFEKRSLEKQNKILSLKKQIVKVDDVKPNTEVGQRVFTAIEEGSNLPPLKQVIQIEEILGTAPIQQTENKQVQNMRDVNAEIEVMANLMTMVNGITNESASSWTSWLTNVLQATSTAIVAIRSVVAAKTAEGAASAGASAAASGPFGWLMIAPAIMSALAAFAAIPQFANGGIVGGSSYFGDKLLARVNSGEMILNQGQQARLLSMTNGGNVRVSGDVRLNGKDIYISLRNYMSSSGNRL